MNLLVQEQRSVTVLAGALFSSFHDKNFMNTALTTKEIRKIIRQQRRSLSRLEQSQHQKAVIRQILQSGLLRKHKRIAIYLDSDGELATDIIIRMLHKMKKKVFLPVLFPLSTNRLFFLPFKKNTHLINNRFNISEPRYIKRHVSVKSLHIIFMPLVAFDEQGNRIGMGGGFYDRTLSHCKLHNKSDLPLLIGLAHELQKVNNIDKQSWDIPLDGLLTEKKLIKYTKAFK